MRKQLIHCDALPDAPPSALPDACRVAPASEIFGRHHGAGDIVARRGAAVTRETFLADIAALAALLPAHDYMLNLCTDRYRFTVGLAAALRRRQITMLPPSDAPGALRDLAADYPDVYALSDAPSNAGHAGLPGLAYPNDLAGDFRCDNFSVPAAQPAIILFTSGSTGRPLAVPKCWGVLTRGADAAGARLGLARLPGASVIGTVPQQHSYGLESTIMLALRHGLIIDAMRPLYPADIRDAIARAPRPRILVTTPVHLQALLAEPDDLPAVDLILSATAPLSAALAGAAEACFGADLIEIYGCTEAGQIATRRTATETQWECLDGISLHQDATGTFASGAAVPGSVRLHDEIEMTGPSTFVLGGRIADLVDVAGKRTSLIYLTHQLLGVAGVRDGVFLLEDSFGNRVPRLMALAVAPGLNTFAIQRALRERIDPAFLPRPLVLVDELPRNGLGKLPRAALLQLARDSRAD